MADLGAYDEDVRFDDGDADGLVNACNGAASAIDGQAASRAAWRNTGLMDFAGYFSQVFADNGRTQATDAGALAAALREVASFVGQLRQAAHDEQARRVKAREWEYEIHHKNLLEKIGGWFESAFTGGDHAPVPPPEPQLRITGSAPAVAPRQTPAPGAGGGGGGGTSSARPESLRSFASSNAGADTGLADWRTKVSSAYTQFTGSCGWGSLDAHGVLGGFQQYLDANAADERWAELVAAAFEQAGGAGSVKTLSDAALAAALRAGGVAESRAAISIDPPSVKGEVPTSGFADDPVNTATGNFVEPETDLEFAGGCASLGFGRAYNSADRAPGGFGPGWSSWTETRLVVSDDDARWVNPDGRHVVFPRQGDGWGRSLNASYWLRRSDGGGLAATDNAGGEWSFAGDGRLEWWARGAGTRVDLLYDGGGRLAGLAHERGRSIAVEWDGGGARVAAVAASDGRRVEYGYDEAGRLVSASGPLGTRRYRWNRDGLVEAVVDADGVVEVSNTYDGRGRVAAQVSPFGRTSRYSYLPGGVTEVADEDGSRANTWIADGLGRLVGVVDADGNRQSTLWDRWGNLVMVTDRAGKATIRDYDDRGRLTRETAPEGADVRYAWDEHDRLTGVVAGDGATTVLEYPDDPGQRNPAALIDPCGGRSEMVWAGGLLTRLVGPTGVAVDLRYDERGDLVATTNPDGGEARLERDAAGLVVAAVTPLGERTEFGYDGRGLLAWRRNPDGGLWRFEHTDAGRLRARVAPDGGRSEIEYGPAGEETKTVDPLGRAVVRALDDLGNLARLELPDGTAWEFTHDALSRPVRAVDPAGGVWATGYDKTGTPTSATDPTGLVRRASVGPSGDTVTIDDGLMSSTARFDQLGRPVAAETTGGGVSTCVYDACGRVVEVLDPEGGLTVLRRDPAGRVVEQVDPEGATTGYEYDSCGRLSAVIDPGGGRTTRQYDADSRLVRQALPNGDVAWAQYDPCGRPTRVHRPGAGTTRYTYDLCGRVTSVRDCWWGHRRFRYDQAGQLVAAVNGLGGVTRYEYDRRGRATRITHPDGGTTERVWDANDRLVRQTDPLGRATTAGYDAAGRQTWQKDPAGRLTEFAFDRAGRLAATSVDGRPVSTITRDLPGRTVRIDDRTGPGPAGHLLEWDRAGRLTRHRRTGPNAGEMTWAYDKAGRRTRQTDPAGRTTEYSYDPDGRLAHVSHPVFGRASFSHDPAGRLTGAATPGLTQTWGWADGHITGHTAATPDGVSRTTVARDRPGRVASVCRDGRTTRYRYDRAGQLASAAWDTGTLEWAYDTSGRPASWRDADGRHTLTHDPAGQLREIRHPDGSATRHDYDPAGRRTRTTTTGGAARDYAWSDTGWLSAITDTAPAGATTTPLHVDATGQLAAIGDTPVWWDTAGALPALAGIGDTPVLPLGPVTGIADHWAAPGWRPARHTTDHNPWHTPAQPAGPGLPPGIGLTGTASLTLAGGPGPGPVEWLTGRAYDPNGLGFLTLDPDEPPAGPPWASNPYAYAANNPLAHTDPAGRHPLTDQQLADWNTNRQGWAAKAWHAATGFLKNNWEYIAGAALVVGGGVLMATGVGGPLGTMMLSAGVDTIIQKATTGTVNWGEVVISGGIGAIPGGGFVARGGATLLRVAADGAVVGGLNGGAMGALRYANSPGPHTITGYLTAVGQGTALGTLTGAAGAAAGYGLTKIGDKLLNAIKPTPATPTAPRLPQDINVDPRPPRPLAFDRPVSQSPTQNQFVTDRATALDQQGAIDVRVNQQQVNVDRTRVGVNRPDLQYTLGDQRHYEEFDVPSSTRGPAHAARIQANDPAGVVSLFTVE